MRTSWALGGCAVILAALAAAGCGKETMVRGMPKAAISIDHYQYKPLDVTPKVARTTQVRPAEPPELPPLPPRVQEPVLPPHDPAWEPPGPKRAWQWIVVHHSASPKGSAAVIDQWHRKGNHWDELGYHFVIGNGTESGDGQIEVGSRWPKQKHGAHTKVGNDETYNETGIGICLVGNFEKARPSAAQMAALAQLVDFLSARYRIDDRHIIGHGWVDDTRCPGRCFSFPDLMQRLHADRNARGALAMTP